MKVIKNKWLYTLGLLLILMSCSVYASNKYDVKALSKAATSGDISAYFLLGKAYEKGSGAEKDPLTAHQYFQKGADLGDARSQNKLGQLYAKGSDILEKDPEKAYKLYSLSADQDFHVALYNKGYSLFRGRGTEQNIDSGLTWMLKAADNNCRRAKMRLGMIYERGDQVEVDNAKAFHWYQRAAIEHNIPPAQEALGRILQAGDGVKKDILKAIYWFEKAANNGRIKSQYALGLIYLYGAESIESDDDKARYWLSKAAKGGHKLAVDALETL